MLTAVLLRPKEARESPLQTHKMFKLYQAVYEKIKPLASLGASAVSHVALLSPGPLPNTENLHDDCYLEK